MHMHRKRHPGSMLLMGLVLGALLGACGAEQPTGETANTVSGVATVGTPTAGLNTCISCHPVTTAEWETTRHANLNSSPSFTTSAYCAGCHDTTGDSQFLSPARMVVACEACHSGGKMHVDGGGSGPIGNTVYTATVVSGTVSTLAVSGQFLTCTGCHQLLDLAGDPASATTPTTAMHSSTTGSVRVITDTHFATPGDFTSGSNSKDITGYAMDYASETVCTDCHNPHGKVNINQEWAQSAHADRNANADPLGYFSTAWAHYDWSMASRAACQRCHTTTGYAKYADALRSGNSALAKGISSGTIPALAFSATPSFKPEMLKCNGCHTNNRGALRNPGTITADYSYSTTTNNITYVVSEASHQYPDVKASNVCMACHTGRESGETLKNLSLTTAPTITSYANLSFINSHYLAAGGTVFTATGYEFDGFSYANISSYRHDQIGSSAAPSTGANGPCVGCHMSRPGGNGDHLFMPVSRSTNTATSGHIDGVASEVCIYCHTVSGAGGLEDLLNERKEEYHEALLATMYVLDKRGFYFRGAHPYFYQARTASTTTVKATATNLSTTVTGTGTLWTGPSGTVIGGDYFKVNSYGTYYKIATVDSDIQLTLETAYAGPTATETDFTIIRSGSAGGIKNWLTQSGTGITAASSTDTDTTGARTGRNNLGAAFNLNLLEHDPGAYVHNRMYTKRLLYDTIDWADDNLMNNSVGTTLTTKLPAGAIYKTGAVKYLLPYGVLGIPAERP